MSCRILTIVAAIATCTFGVAALAQSQTSPASSEKRITKLPVTMQTWISSAITYQVHRVAATG
jgi:hypothetical protein